MEEISQKFLNIDQRIRVYIRFLIENLTVTIIYSTSLLTSESYEYFTTTNHIIYFIIWVTLYLKIGLHKDQIRFSSLKSYQKILKITIIISSVLTVNKLVYNGNIDVLESLSIFLVTLNSLIILRLTARQLLRRVSSKTRSKILVYGTNYAAIDFANAITFGRKYRVVGFISDTAKNLGHLAGLPVIHLKDVASFSELNQCKHIVIINHVENDLSQNKVLSKFDSLGLSVSYAPTMDRAFDYEVQLKAVNPEEILGRVSEIPFDESVEADLENKTILITGAGGSIGSELCRQIIRYKPSQMVLLELNELALYQLEEEITVLLTKYEHPIEIFYHLGSVTDETILKEIFTRYKINNVYHAAAYKHVPIVEANIISGLKNNVFGTKMVADYSHKFEISKFVLVSSDKAVRPTNVMGASKRLSELVIQDLASRSDTKFTMVRFGNVLGSSGSVIPKFKSQINSGGPVTVTSEDITRYFMSIPEAAHLVLNAGSLANGGEVFLLDMGEPFKIVDLAKKMIRQHGMQPIFPRDLQKRKQQHNEIMIEFSGLRPGEKLYEELLIDGIFQKTPNAKIFKAQDKAVDHLDLSSEMQRLNEHIMERNYQAIYAQLHDLPLSYQTVKATAQDLRLISETKAPKIEHILKHEQHTASLSTTKSNELSLVKNILSSKFGSAILHKYFLITRAMTLGVRVLLRNREGQILLVKQTYNSGWHLPGGGVDCGEDIETAARRETLEECGIDALFDLQFVKLEHNETVSKRDHIAYFIANSSQEPANHNKLEITDAKFFSIEDLPEDVNVDVKKLLDELKIKTSVSISMK